MATNLRSRRALALVGGLPATIGFGRFDLGQPRRSHRAGCEQCFRLLAVDLRPAAAGTARREPLQEMALVEAALLAVDPGNHALAVIGRLHAELFLHCRG